MWETIFISCLTAIVGGFIGTYGGAWFLIRENEGKNLKLRRLAVSALNIFKKYAKDGKTFKSVEEEFNNDCKISHKRAYLVLLHKLGIPIQVPLEKNFDIKNIEFLEEKINKEMLCEIEEQINSGYCDNLFYIDVDTYYGKELITKTRRDIALRYIDNAMCDVEVKSDSVYLKQDWYKKFSEAELNTIYVFKRKNSTNMYYADNGEVNYEEIEKLKSDVRKGLWDDYLNWDIDAYSNIIAQRDMAGLMSQAIQAQQQTQPPPILTPQALEQLAQILPQQLAQLQANTSQQEIANDTK